MVPNSRVLLWANMRRGPSLAVPGPTDDKSSPYWWLDRIAEWAEGWARNGVTDVLFPNPVKGQSGSFRTGDGYNPFDHYDLGSKNQMGSVETRFGSANKLRRAIAICRANGITVHLDIVMHQCMGGQNGVYRYLGADGKTKNGRFPKDPPCFRGAPPRVAEDPDIPDVPDDFAFGDEIEVITSLPKNYMWDNLIAWGDWLFRTTGASGGRVDDEKGASLSFMRAWMSSGAMASKFFFGEYASGAVNDLNWWVAQVDGRASALDFAWHYHVAQPMGNNAGSPSFDIRSTIGQSMCDSNSMKAVTWVESMDSDSNGWAAVVNNKQVIYARLLADVGLPMVYVGDYLKEPDCYGLRDPINNLMWCSRNLANGPKVDRYSDKHVYVFERTGEPGSIMAINLDVFNPAWKTVTVQTQMTPGTVCHDYSGGNDEPFIVDQHGMATFGIPPGTSGNCYGWWAPEGMSAAIVPPVHSCTQELFGDVDLDIGPAINGTHLVSYDGGREPVRFWIAKGSPITAGITIDSAGWTEATRFLFQVIGPDSQPYGGSEVSANAETAETHSVARVTGWHTIQFEASGMPADGSPFVFKINYTATQTLTPDEF